MIRRLHKNLEYLQVEMVLANASTVYWDVSDAYSHREEHSFQPEKIFYWCVGYAKISITLSQQFDEILPKIEIPPTIEVHFF